MPRKPQQPRKTEDPDQLRRFREMAREVEADDTEGAMDRAFDRVIRDKPTPRSDTDSDQKPAKP